MKLLSLITLIICLLTINLSAQTNQIKTEKSYLEMNWKKVARNMPAEWYGSNEAILVADKVLLCQKEIGGWAKNKKYHKLSKAEIKKFVKTKNKPGATFDNGATILELKFLAKVYAHVSDERYKQAIERGINYIFISQYENGGWPQFYPTRTEKEEHYCKHITYNDNSMVNVMRFLQDIYEGNNIYDSLKINTTTKAKAQKAFNKGIECILKTQIIVNGKPTIWCAQHHYKTLAPAKARAYELPSYSGAESVNITELLMSIENPSEEISAAIEGSVNWFKEHKLEGIKKTKEKDKKGRKNLIIIEDKNALPLWARFYDLETEEPFFCDRDGIKKASIAEIGHERRNGYGWYTNKPRKLLEEYEVWKEKQLK